MTKISALAAVTDVQTTDEEGTGTIDMEENVSTDLLVAPRPAGGFW